MAELSSIAYKIQGNLNQYREIINAESLDLIPEAEIEWISEENRESFFDEFKGKVIIRMHPSTDNDVNLVKATLMQVSKGVIPSSRMYIEPKMNTSIDLSLVKKILLSQKEDNAYGYFINEIMVPELKDNEMISYMESIEFIEKRGFFTRLFLRELKDLHLIEGLGFTNILNIRKDIKNFFYYSEKIAKRKPGELIPLVYEGLIIKTAVIMIAVTYKMMTMGKIPYIKRAISYRAKGHEIIFLIAFDHAIDFTKAIINDLETKYGMKLIKGSDIEYFVDTQRFLCATIHTSAKNYREKESLKLKQNAKLIDTLKMSVNETKRDNGWSMLTDVGNKIKEKITDFDLEELGYEKLSDIFFIIDIFEVDEKEIDEVTYVSVRIKKD